MREATKIEIVGQQILDTLTGELAKSMKGLVREYDLTADEVMRAITLGCCMTMISFIVADTGQPECEAEVLRKEIKAVIDNWQSRRLGSTDESAG